MRIVWVLTIETKPREDPGLASGSVLRWAIIGLAVLGVAAVISVRLLNR